MGLINGGSGGGDVIPPQSSGSIQEITSEDDSVTITDPDGPIVDLSVAAGGATGVSGDVTGGPGVGQIPTTIAEIQGIPIVITTPATGDVIQYDGTEFANVPGVGGGSISTITSEDDSVTITDPDGPITDLSVVFPVSDITSEDATITINQTGSVFDLSVAGGGGGTISTITSADGSIVVTDPTGPSTDVSAANANTAAGYRITDTSSAGITLNEAGAGAIAITSSGGGITLDDSSDGTIAIGTSADVTVAIGNSHGGGTIVTVTSSGGTTISDGSGGELVVDSDVALSTAGGVVSLTAGSAVITLTHSDGGIAIAASNMGFFSATPINQPTLTGDLTAVTDPNVKDLLTSLIGALSATAGLGLFIDGTS